MLPRLLVAAPVFSLFPDPISNQGSEDQRAYLKYIPILPFVKIFNPGKSCA